MKPVLPFLIAIALAVPAAFVPVIILPVIVLAPMAATLWAVWRCPLELERSRFACGVCGFREELSTAASGRGMVVHRCCGPAKQR